jgi:hypothetical protein
LCGFEKLAGEEEREATDRESENVNKIYIKTEKLRV